MNLANKLTVGRMGMTILLVAVLANRFPFSYLLALLLFIAAAITDYFDGKLAREKYGVTTFGKLMDPLADKLLVSAALISLVSPAMGNLLPAWMVIIIIAREFMVTGLRLLAAGEGTVIAAGAWGKHKTVWQLVAVITILVGVTFTQDINPLLLEAGINTSAQQWVTDSLPTIAYILGLLATAITLISGWVYFRESKELVLRET